MVAAHPRRRLIDLGVIAVLIGMSDLLAPALASASLVWGSPMSVDTAALEGVSCPSTTLCVAVDYAGNVVTSVDPEEGAGAWTEAHVDSNGALGGISCPTANLCVAIDNIDDVVTSTDPTGGPSAWSLPVTVDSQPHSLLGVSCPTANLCAVIDSAGNVITSTDPTGGATAWNTAHVGNSGLTGISCPSEKLCVLTDEGSIIISKEPAKGAGSWEVKHVAAARRISCPSENLCVTVAELATEIVWGDPLASPSRWPEAYIEGLNGLDEVSCAKEDLCVATSYGGNGSPGNVIASNNPSGGLEAWEKGNVYGRPIVPPNPILPLAGIELTGVSCPSASLCAVTDIHGSVMLGTPARAPVATSMPALSGTPAVGQTLSCSAGSWTGNPTPMLAYGWLRDGISISGANASTYVVQATDQGHGLACQITATNSAGSVNATSNTLSVLAAQESRTCCGPLGGGTDNSNLFSLVNMASMAKHGAIRLTLNLPGPGALQIIASTSVVELASRTKRKRRRGTIVIARLRLTVSNAGQTIVTLTPTRSAKIALAKQGRLRAIVTVTYTPENGESRSIVRDVVFRLIRRR